MDNGNLSDRPPRRLTAFTAAVEQLEKRAQKNTRGELVSLDFLADLSKALRKRAEAMRWMEMVEQDRRGHRGCLVEA